jgi:hypothetical protein
MNVNDNEEVDGLMDGEGGWMDVDEGGKVRQPRRRGEDAGLVVAKVRIAQVESAASGYA